MPRAARKAAIITSKTKPKTKEHKQSLITKIAPVVLSSQLVYVLHFSRPNNAAIRNLRVIFNSEAQIFMASHGIMKQALQELGPKGESLAKLFKGQSAILCTKLPLDEVKQRCVKATSVCYAEAGYVAQEDIIIGEGLLNADFYAVQMESHLRSLGLPCTVDNEKIRVLTNFAICKKDDVINSTQAKLLKHFGHELGQFAIEPVGYFKKAENDIFLLKDELAQLLD
ncbi:Ribosomal protein L10 [Spironucleus salmonicida]|uniref:Acidic ribosomal protein P0 n=1 Tax=Spironucleus salmonicida TaxID=348837 RepID=V6LWZ5_9EUKA|nr:Ribosomal protein L10 [Spironucleus salmonicida]|eukprot:EST45329.1 Acidic ribosomal protein P0 [Spironucleus salmonicida]